MGENFSSQTIVNYLKTNVEPTTRATILNFTNYLEDAMLISKTRREDLIGKRILQTKQKYYLMDHGFHEAIIGNNMTKISHIIENIVYIELLRRGYDVKIGCIKRGNGNDMKIDFVCTKGNERKYIQVSYSLASDKTIEREFKPLLMVNDNYDKYVISMDDFDMSRDGIKHLNLIDFLLDDDAHRSI